MFYCWCCTHERCCLHSWTMCLPPTHTHMLTAMPRQSTPGRFTIQARGNSEILPASCTAAVVAHPGRRARTGQCPGLTVRHMPWRGAAPPIPFAGSLCDNRLEPPLMEAAGAPPRCHWPCLPAARQGQHWRRPAEGLAVPRQITVSVIVPCTTGWTPAALPRTGTTSG